MTTSSHNYGYLELFAEVGGYLGLFVDLYDFFIWIFIMGLLKYLNVVSKRRRKSEMPSCAKMVVNEQFGDFIGRFLEQYFKVYDTDNREQLAAAYHENAMMSMQANFAGRFSDDITNSDYKPESRNLNIEFIRENPGRRDRLLHHKRTQIIGFLDKLPKTQHDIR